MIVLVGVVVVLAAVAGGYVMEGGHLHVLFQPAELVIIGGAALGAMLIGTPIKTLVELLRQLPRIVGRSPSRKDYQELLVMLYRLLNVARRDGLPAVENHVEKPNDSAILGQYPTFLRNHHAVHFLCDTLRLIISGAAIQPHDLEAMLDMDIDTHHEEKAGPSRVLQVLGDSLPGLGIVAAVLGIVIAMGAIDGPPEELGHKVGAALVGTFLGVLLAYGFMQPLANTLASRQEEEGRYVQAIKWVLLAFHRGAVPLTAVEFARRSLFSHCRPSFTDLESACRAAK
jgi:chemotaxis protein MotA